MEYVRDEEGDGEEEEEGGQRAGRARKAKFDVIKHIYSTCTAVHYYATEKEEKEKGKRKKKRGKKMKTKQNKGKQWKEQTVNLLRR